MPEQNEQQPISTHEPNNVPDSSETPPSSSEPVAPAAPPAPKVYTDADGVPSWAVGKTDAEIMALTGNLMETMKTFDPSAQATPPATTYQAPAPAQVTPSAGPAMPSADLAYTDPAAYNAQLEAYWSAREARLKADLTNQFQSVMQPINQTMGSMARQQIANDPIYKEVFDKWGHEVDQEFAKNGVGPNQRTPDAYRLVGDIIRGRHVQDLARAEADRILASGGHAPTVRAGTGGAMVPAAPPGDAFDAAWDANEIGLIKMAKQHGVSKDDLRKSISMQGHSVDDWVKMVSGGNVFVSPDGKNVRTLTSGNRGTN
jgi:hypothetical protein